MKKLTLALAAMMTLAFTAAPAAAQLANFTIETGLVGDLEGSPTTATITGGIDYGTFFASSAGGSSAVTGFNVLVNGTGNNFNEANFSPFAGGVNAVLTLDTAQTGTLNFFSSFQANALFSFALSGLFTADGQGALPGGGITVSNASSIANTTINAGSPGTLAVTAAVPEPATWAMMLMGFGAMGVSLRRRRKLTSIAQLA